MQPSTSLSLTAEQHEIVTAAPAHYIVTAVAGSGKTTTLAHRINYLLDQGFSARRILVLMFNKAAKLDFASKLKGIAQQHAQLPEVRTFHAMGYRLYNRFVQEGALRSFNKQVLSDKEIDFHIWRMLMQVLDAEQLKDAKRNKKDYVEVGHQFIESVKNSLNSPEVTLETLQLNDKFSFLPQLFEVFESWRKDHSRISYTDMLYDPVQAIAQQPRLKELVGNKMDMILVDEYQDTNDLQHALLSYIAGTRAKITVVGDPDQTIYEFRGAKPEYIINGFSEQFPDASKLNLSYSFRYGHRVSLLANHLIAHNSGRQNILCKSHESNPKTQVSVHPNKDEPKATLEILKAMPPQALSSCAILTRVWSQTVGIELALIEQGLPYHMDGYPGVFHSHEAHCLKAIMELASGIFSQLPLEVRAEKLDLLCHFPHVGLPDPQIKALCYSLAQFPANWGSMLKQTMPGELKRIQAIKLERLADMLSYLEKKPTKLASALSHYFQETQLFEGIRSLSLSHDHAEEKVASIKGIARFLAQHNLSIVASLDLFDSLRQASETQKQQGRRQTTQQGIQLSTIHRAKGLEWQHVIIPGINSKTFPYTYKDEPLSKAQLESERRLLYVAMTRAKQHLHLLLPEAHDQSARSRFQHELNIDESLNLGAKADQDANSITTGAVSRISQRYFSELDIELQTDNASPSKADGKTGGDIIWYANTVQHVLLGKGAVKGETGSAFSVEFEDQETRTFSKETAERFFTILD